MSYLEELLPEFRKGAKIRRKCWENGRFHTIKGRSGLYYNMEEFKADDWELYQEPIDWDYIIKNKCLCWFWDDDESNKKLGVLSIKDADSPYPFYYDSFRANSENCRPVRRDEVTFYEEKEDGK